MFLLFFIRIAVLVVIIISTRAYLSVNGVIYTNSQPRFGTIYFTMATYWVSTLPDVKGFSDNLWRLISIFPNDALKIINITKTG